MSNIFTLSVLLLSIIAFAMSLANIIYYTKLTKNLGSLNEFEVYSMLVMSYAATIAFAILALYSAYLVVTNYYGTAARVLEIKNKLSIDDIKNKYTDAVKNRARYNQLRGIPDVQPQN
jgi:hypothetical protein